MEDFIVFIVSLTVGLIFGITFCVIGIVCCIALCSKRSKSPQLTSPTVVTAQTYHPSGQTVYPASVITTHEVRIDNVSLQDQNQPMIQPQTTQNTNLYPQQTVQMPLAFPNVELQFQPSNQPPYPSQMAVNIPLPVTSQTYEEQNALNDERDDDLPPSYHKIDKLQS